MHVDTHRKTHCSLLYDGKCLHSFFHKGTALRSEKKSKRLDLLLSEEMKDGWRCGALTADHVPAERQSITACSFRCAEQMLQRREFLICLMGKGE